MAVDPLSPVGAGRTAAVQICVPNNGAVRTTTLPVDVYNQGPYRPWRIRIPNGGAALHAPDPDALHAAFESHNPHLDPVPPEVEAFWNELNMAPRLAGSYDRVRRMLHRLGKATQGRVSNPKYATRSLRAFLSACSVLESRYVAHAGTDSVHGVLEWHRSIGAWLATLVQGGTDVASIVIAMHATSHGVRRAARYDGWVKQLGKDAERILLTLLQRADLIGIPDELLSGNSPVGAMWQAMLRAGITTSVLAEQLHYGISAGWGMDPDEQEIVEEVWTNWLGLHGAWPSEPAPMVLRKRPLPPREKIPGDKPSIIPRLFDAMPEKPDRDRERIMHRFDTAHSGFRGAAMAQEVVIAWRGGYVERLREPWVETVVQVILRAARPDVAVSVFGSDLKHYLGAEHLAFVAAVAGTALAALLTKEFATVESEPESARAAKEDAIFHDALGTMVKPVTPVGLEMKDRGILGGAVTSVSEKTKDALDASTFVHPVSSNVISEKSRRPKETLDLELLSGERMNSDPSRILLMKGRVLEYDLKAGDIETRAKDYLLTEQRDRRRDMQWMILGRQLFLEFGNVQPRNFPGNAGLVIDGMVTLAFEQPTFSRYLHDVVVRLPRDPLASAVAERSVKHITTAALSAPWPDSAAWSRLTPQMRLAVFVMALATRYDEAEQRRLMQFASQVVTGEPHVVKPVFLTQI